MSVNVRKAFIDCGAHDGMSIRLLRSAFPSGREFEVHAFEPNPGLFHKLSLCAVDATVSLYEAAVSTVDGRVPFYLGDPLSSTLRPDKTTGKVDVSRPIDVRSIRLATWMLNEFSPGDHVVLKLDIEGTEYDVLPDLIETGAIFLVTELYGEWHVGKLQDVTNDQHRLLIDRLAALGLRMKGWAAEAGRFER